MIDTDKLLARLRERAVELATEYNQGHCLNCHADLTAADREGGECSNCHSAVEVDDEDLQDDGDEFEFDWYNANGLFDELE